MMKSEMFPLYTGLFVIAVIAVYGLNVDLWTACIQCMYVFNSK